MPPTTPYHCIASYWGNGLFDINVYEPVAATTERFARWYYGVS